MNVRREEALAHAKTLSLLTNNLLILEVFFFPKEIPSLLYNNKNKFRIILIIIFDKVPDHI